jgi:ubiquinone/menaquinone biosynthesis C-methylase UbiE
LASLITRGSVFALPYPAETFDTVVSTFALSGLPDGDAAMAEMARVAGPGGRVALVDIGLPSDGNRVGTFWARLWERMGDYLYDQPALMQATGLTVVTFEAFGPGRHIRAVVGEKPLCG